MDLVHYIDLIQHTYGAAVEQGILTYIQSMTILWKSISSSSFTKWTSSKGKQTPHM